MEEAIFVFDAEDATVVAKIDVGKGNGLTGIHITRVSSLQSYARARLGVVPEGGIRAQSCRVIIWTAYRTSLPACLMILDVIGDLLADGCQIEELLLDKGIFGLFGKLAIHNRLLPKIVVPVHASSCPARP
jgi:hypothetical protein